MTDVSSTDEAIKRNATPLEVLCDRMASEKYQTKNKRQQNRVICQLKWKLCEAEIEDLHEGKRVEREQKEEMVERWIYNNNTYDNNNNT